MSAIILGDVRKTYAGGVEAVKGVSFAVPDGGFCVLVGPSGCGKSTLLRMVAGLETVSAGDITIGGVRVNDKEPMDRDIAMVFQNYALYPHMTVRNNMAYGLRNRGMTVSEIDTRVSEAARILGLDDAMLKRLPKQLSGGQRQRVAMGRAIVRKPQAFLFDEPLSNLDAKLRGQMRIEIRKLQKRLGTTSLYVTHDQLEAMTLADMLVVLNGGKVEQVGAPLAVYDNPASLFVAGFIGAPAMNFLNGTIGAPGVVHLESGFDLAYKVGDFAARPGDAVIAGVRPENAMASPGGSLTFTVDLVEELGGGRLVYGRVGEAPFTIQQGAQAHWPPGETIKLSVPASAVHLFDPKTGLRLPGSAFEHP